MLSRLALRLCTMEALRPTACLAEVNPAPFPLLAGADVFDTLMSPISMKEKYSAVVVLFTEEDNRDPGQLAGGPPYKRTVDFVIEMSIVAQVPNPDNLSIYDPAIPESDSETEASLDILEAQVDFQLQLAPAGRMFRELTGQRITDFRSTPMRSSEEGARMAIRQLRMKITFDDDIYVAAPTAVAQGLDRLPQPLRGVISKLADTHYGKELATSLAVRAPVMPVVTPLKTATFSADVADSQGNTDGIADMLGSAENLDQ